jgi:hypothetical protein
MSAWTKDPPTESGWYWVRSRDESAPQVVLVDRDGEALRYFAVASELDWPLRDFVYWGPRIEPPVYE